MLNESCFVFDFHLICISQPVVVFLGVLVQANPVYLVVQGWRSRQSIRDGGICPGVAPSPLRDAEHGLGLGGRQERHWPWPEDLRRGSAQARLHAGQRLSGSRRVSRQDAEGAGSASKCPDFTLFPQVTDAAALYR